MAWETSPIIISDDVSIQGTSWQDASNPVSLNPNEAAMIEIEFDPPTTPTEQLIVGVFYSIDGGTTYDSEPARTFTLPEDVADPYYKNFFVVGPHTFRLQYKMSSTSDTATVRARSRKDGVSA
jgi:hypothetical protein